MESNSHERKDSPKDQEFWGEKNENTDEKLQAYLGSPYEVLGLSRAQIDLIIREFAREMPKISSTDLNTLADDLWTQGETYDERAVAISLLNRYSKLLDDKHGASWIDGWSKLRAGDCVML